jgi:hypothetical protein
MTELIKAMRRNWRHSGSLRQQLLVENTLPLEGTRFSVQN